MLAVLIALPSFTLAPWQLRPPSFPRTPVFASATDGLRDVIVERDPVTGSLGLDVDQNNVIASNRGQSELRAGEEIVAVDGEPLGDRSIGACLAPGAPSYTFSVRDDPVAAARSLEAVLLEMVRASDSASRKLVTLEAAGEKAESVVAALESTRRPAGAGLADQLQGFWKLVLTSDESLAAAGLSGFGDQNIGCSVVAHYVCFATKSPSAQVVEVVANANLGSHQLAALKGEFSSDNEAEGGPAVLEEYSRLEFAGSPQLDAPALSRRWLCTFIGERLRVCREDAPGGAIHVYERCDNAQGEIGDLLSRAVASSDPAAAQWAGGPAWAQPRSGDGPPTDAGAMM